ncbi:hypothetical protein swp_4413 [Shewanella piezotolerans WP3]|uniref:Uncharacterized protein n=1 Tax=Shewanella piezotolerans (strain WP3 / JCM 13877) TaxID=225849 RepID=B8CTE9_SHEPW|nr:hypothetical protein swp_4413 [Shewanella piezotolerans WP3]
MCVDIFANFFLQYTNKMYTLSILFNTLWSIRTLLLNQDEETGDLDD